MATVKAGCYPNLLRLKISLRVNDSNSSEGNSSLTQSSHYNIVGILIFSNGFFLYPLMIFLICDYTSSFLMNLLSIK